MKRTALLSILIFCAAGTLAAQNFNISANLRRHVEYLASDALQGRAAGTEGEKEAASYIYDKLEKAGLIMLTGPAGQDFSIKRPDGNISSANVLGIVEGSDPKLRNEYIVVGAHMDGLGLNHMTIDGRKVSQLYPGADDNASGVAALVELAGLVSANRAIFGRSVVFIAFGAGEQGNAGAWYFVNRAFENIGNVRAMVNLDMLGRGTEQYPFRLYSSLSKTSVDRLMASAAEQPIVAAPLVSSGTFPQSDYLPFYEKNIPFVHFTTGMTREYHSLKDTPNLVISKYMERHCNYIFYFLQTLSVTKHIQDAEVSAADSEPVYSVADLDKRPEFFHSNEKHFLDAWVYKYVKYPASAVRDRVSGKVTVSFIVEKDGSVSNVEVIRSLDQRLDDEAVKVISISPKWTPGQIKGRPVRTRITVPVEFRLK